MDSQQGRGEGLPTGPCSGLSKALHTLQAEPAANSALLGPLLLLPPAQLSGVSLLWDPLDPFAAPPAELSGVSTSGIPGLCLPCPGGEHLAQGTAASPPCPGEQEGESTPSVLQINVDFLFSLYFLARTLSWLACLFWCFPGSWS